MAWSIGKKKEILKTVPFSVEEIEVIKDGKALENPYHRIICPDWVNVLPITSSGHAVMIRQKRAGNGEFVLEIPGGVVDPSEVNDPTMAAARELEEETGFTTQRLLPLISVNPNPAIQNNKVHLFLALDCELTAVRNHFPDENEEIEIELVKVSDLDTLVRTGRIDHSLCCLCIVLAAKYLDKFS